jgi:hypothetical protein
LCDYDYSKHQITNETNNTNKNDDEDEETIEKENQLLRQQL